MSNEETDADLLSTQLDLQAEAMQVLRDLDIEALAGPIGEPIVVGSAALGLMVWRDIDLTVVCGELDVAAVAAFGARLAVDPRVREVRFRNDSGAWKTDSSYPDGLYIGLSFQSRPASDWNVDIWFIDDPESQPDLEHVRSLPALLSDERRIAILRIKSTWALAADYGRTVRSVDVYRAVLDGGAKSPDAFAAWLNERDRGQWAS
jgi:hypothetical protein